MNSIDWRLARSVSDRMHAMMFDTAEWVKENRRSPSMQLTIIERRFERYHDMANHLREVLKVAKKTQKYGDWKGFATVAMTDAAKAQFEAWDCHDGDVFDSLASYGEGGYKLSVSYNKQTGSWVASYTGTQDAGKNSGYTISGFAPTVYEALRVLLFKVSVLAPENWEDAVSATMSGIG